MADDLKKLNSLDKKRKDLLKKLDMIEEKKSTVTLEVYEKVKGDYEERLTKIADEMKKLEGAVRGEIEKLVANKEDIETRVKEIKLKEEEIELRYSLGEYEEDQYKKLKGEIDKGMANQKGSLKKIVDRVNWLKELLGEEKIEETEEVEEVSEAEELAESEEELTPVAEEAETGPEEEGGGVEKEAEILLDEILKASDEKNKEEEAEEETAEETETKKEADKVQCPKCGFLNEPDSWYCEKCGAEILGAPEGEK